MADEKIRHLEVLREDARDEIKRRIEQRDKYSIQFTIALSAAIAVAFFSPDLRKILIVAPLLSIYFTVLILYSYRMHEVLALYLRTKIEPELAKLCGTSIDLEWERFCESLNVVAVRKFFFLLMLWVIFTGYLVYLWYMPDEKGFEIVLWFLTTFYFSAILVITIVFRKKKDRI